MYSFLTPMYYWHYIYSRYDSYFVSLFQKLPLKWYFLSLFPSIFFWWFFTSGQSKHKAMFSNLWVVVSWHFSTYSWVHLQCNSCWGCPNFSWRLYPWLEGYFAYTWSNIWSFDSSFGLGNVQDLWEFFLIFQVAPVF